ncbi:GNAT family N-acetyltransferase [Streptomyces sp. NPDC057257]|uniref:GNAT family N-acetyltransferase n=1 Tax=Streptomyces sp. NPDC057257 TaxID=3346071 RepID=UPI00363B9EAF
MRHDDAASQAPIIRPRNDKDLPEASKALVEVHAVDGYPVEGVENPQAWLTPAGMLQAWVAEKDSEIVGHVTVSRPQGEVAVSLYLHQSHVAESQVAVLARLFVHPKARKDSLGRRLVQAATEYAKERNLRLVLDVMVKDAAAIRLYERLGWQSLGKATHAYGNGQETGAICYVSPTG